MLYSAFSVPAHLNNKIHTHANTCAVNQGLGDSPKNALFNTAIAVSLTQCRWKFSTTVGQWYLLGRRTLKAFCTNKHTKLSLVAKFNVWFCLILKKPRLTVCFRYWCLKNPSTDGEYLCYFIISILYWQQVSSFN